MIYFLLLALLFCFAFYEIYSGNKKQSDRLFFFSIVMLVLLDGLRWETGTDWAPYLRFFLTSDRPSAEFNYFEPGYVVFTRIFKKISDSYTLFLFAHSIFCYSLIGSTIKKYAKFPLLTLALYYCIMLPYQGMNRQYMAMAILIFSIRYIFSRSLWRFLLCLVLAFQFHRSSLIFIFAYWMVRPQKLLVYIIIYSVFVLISLSGIINRVPPELFYFLGENAGDKADRYMYAGATSSFVYTLMSIAKRSLWIVAVLLYYKAFIRVKHFALYYNFFFFASCILLVIGNSVMQAFGRSILTYSVFEAFIIPYLLYIFKNNQTRVVMFGVVALYGSLVLYKGIMTYTDLLGLTSPFIPYKCVLFT